MNKKEAAILIIAAIVILDLLVFFIPVAAMIFGFTIFIKPVRDFVSQLMKDLE